MIKALTLALAGAMLYAQPVKTGKLPEAAVILDRYVQATGGADAYRQFAADVTEATVTPETGKSYDVTIARSRAGERNMTVEGGDQTGVHGQDVWLLSPTMGAHIVTGKAAERQLALAHGFTPETWRQEFPEARTEGEEAINGRKRYRLKLVRTDGSRIERFFDEQSGLLVREQSSEFDENGFERPAIVDVNAYGAWQGLQQPSSLQIKSEGHNRTIKIQSVDFTKFVPSDVFVIPHAVIRAIADSKVTDHSLPSAVSLMDRFIEATGGKEAYDSIKSQRIKGEISFENAGVKGQLLLFSGSKGRQYMSFDLAGAGKFESGSDGATAWERSVMLGPRLVPKSSALTGNDPEQILQWSTTFSQFETVSKDIVDGSPCYVVRMQATEKAASSTSCFDVTTGYLVRVSGRFKSEMGEAAMDLIMSDYRMDGPIRMPHHIQTKVSGLPVSVDVTEVEINGPIPAGTFDLPADVRALKEKRASDAAR